MADSAFQSDADQRRRDNEDSLYKLVALDKQREDAYFKLVDLDKDHLDALQKETKLRQDDWRNQQADSDRFYRQLHAAESAYQSLLSGRSKTPGGSAPKTPAPALASPANQTPAGLGGEAFGAVNSIKSYVQTAASSFAIPTTALGAFTLALNQGVKALESYNKGFNAAGHNEGQSADVYAKGNPLYAIVGSQSNRNDLNDTNMSRLGRWITGKSWKPGTNYEDTTSYVERAANYHNARIDRQEQEASIGMQEQADSRRRELGRDKNSMEATLKYGFNNQADYASIQRAVTGAKEQALAAAGNTPGYGREAEQQDISRKAALAESLARMDAERRREAAISASQGQFNKKEASGLEGALKGDQRNIDAKTEELRKAKDSGQNELAGNIQNQLATFQSSALSHNQQLQDVTSKEKERENSELEKNNNLVKERTNALMSERNALSSVVQEEKAKKQSRAENFGLMLPGQRAAALQTAKDYAAGKQWTRQEFELAKSMPEHFGTALRKMGAEIGGKDSAELDRLMGNDVRGKKGEGERAALDAKINVDVTGLDQNLATQVTEKLLPQLSALVDQISQQLNIKMDKNRQEAAAQRAATVVN